MSNIRIERIVYHFADDDGPVGKIEYEPGDPSEKFEWEVTEEFIGHQRYDRTHHEPSVAVVIDRIRSLCKQVKRQWAE